MTKHQNVAGLGSVAYAWQTPITRQSLSKAAFAICKQNQGKFFKLFHGVEYMTPSDVRSLQTSGTLLEPFEEALETVGFSTNGTAGALMDSPLMLTSEDIHAIACDCGHGYERISGEICALLIEARFFLQN